ncbi:alkaline phytoceramidase [Nitrosomonas sp. Nm34]|uniref:alkaline phytoceramidase n=1 Tax=Nitrosomonas sp. Nm34 TaxID=1881055 RepID=UPI0008F42470|nr:alkaline phytoceramidase [Nitrosomonas sp. Nm34]SFI91907.1 Ceramidase [Nitrosomonas sp. Nm34]
MKTRFYILILLFIMGLLVAAILPPIPQPLSYHEFIDQRSFLGIPNFLNVVSNLAFLFVGVAGVVFLRRMQVLLVQKTFSAFSECWPYVTIFLSIILVSMGSAYYHWQPDNHTLFWDRFPITIAIMGLLAATMTERIGVKQGLRWLPVLLIMGVASATYWYWSELQGAGNLNFYIVVQICSILSIILLAIWFPSCYTRGRDIYVIIFLYGLAKLAEILDEEIYHFGQMISGHTLKHLLAGFAAYWMLRMLKKRRLLERFNQGDQIRKYN